MWPRRYIKYGKHIEDSDLYVEISSAVLSFVFKEYEMITTRTIL
jgi:hypothetical protein